MPSANATWQGSCPDIKKRGDLIDHLQELAELAHRCFEQHTPYRYWKKMETGKVLVDGALVGDALPRPAIELRVAGPAPAPPPRSPGAMLEIPYVQLHGVEFRLPNNFYSQDRVSFMFAFQDQQIHLPWVLVGAEDKNQCNLYTQETIRGADLLLIEPEIHMRYSGEDWLCELLAWVKRYYMPDLYYWCRGDLPRYAQFERLDPANLRERDISWRLLLENLVDMAGPLRQPARKGRAR
jgi:hypothetical protein